MSLASTGWGRRVVAPSPHDGFGSGVVLGEDPVQRPARLAEQAGRRRDLRGGAAAGDLTDGAGQLADGVTQVEDVIADVSADLLPRGSGGAPRLVGGLTGGGQGEDLLALGRVGGHQALILEVLERRVDRARAGCPDPAAAVGDL